MKRKKKRREYLILLTRAISAMHSSVNSFNKVFDPSKFEICLIMMTSAWELLGKSILIKRKHKIAKDKYGSTLSAAEVLSKLRHFKYIDETQEDCIQQIVSLRHEAVHYCLPQIPEEVLHHLFYFGCKFFKDIIEKEYPAYAKELQGNFLSLSFSNLTTYAEKVQRLVGRFKKSENDKKIVWLLERGIRFDGGSYISQSDFERQFRTKGKIFPCLKVAQFIKNAEMVRIVPIQAPKSFTADITLRKGKTTDKSLPVLIKKTQVEDDYPYLTGEMAKQLNKTQNFVAYATKKLNLKDDPHYHQKVRASKSSVINRYSRATLDYLRKYLKDNPNFNPYK